MINPGLIARSQPGELEADLVAEQRGPDALQPCVLAYCETTLMEKLPAPYGRATAARCRGVGTFRGRRALRAFALLLLKFVGLDG